jgi:hypothetical protein
MLRYIRSEAVKQIISAQQGHLKIYGKTVKNIDEQKRINYIKKIVIDIDKFILLNK